MCTESTSLVQAVPPAAVEVAGDPRGVRHPAARLRLPGRAGPRVRGSLSQVLCILLCHHQIFSSNKIKWNFSRVQC